MSYTFNKFYTTQKIAAATVTNISGPLPGVTAMSYIHRTGSTFLTSGVTMGMGAQIAGSGAGNDGTHLIVAVIDEETLIVRAALTAEAGVATVAILRGEHSVDIVDETTTDLATMYTQCGEPAIMSKLPVIGKGNVGPVQWAYVTTLANINFDFTTANTINWASIEELLFSIVDTAGGLTIREHSSGAPATSKLNLTLGQLHTPSDYRSYKRGSVFVNVRLLSSAPKFFTTKFYGSYLSNVSSASKTNPGEDPQWCGVMLNGAVDISGSSQVNGAEFFDVINFSGNAHPPASLDTILLAENVMLGYSTTQALLVSGGTVVFTDFGIGGDTYSPPYGLLFTTVRFLDLKSNVDLSTLASVIFLATAEKAYTFNPIFAGHKKNPAVGALVSIYKINDASPGTETPVSGSPFTTDANGQINSGAGYVMVTQDTTAAGVYNNYSYRVKVEASGYMLLDGLFKPTHKTEGQRPLRLYEPALEGEEASL